MRQTIREFSVVDAWSKGITYHWRNFRGATLKSGDQWRRQDLVPGAHDDHGAKGAQWGGVCGGCPLPSRLGVLGERRELTQRGPGGAPAAIAVFCIF